MEDREPLNEKRVRLAREKAIRDTLDLIHEMGTMWKTDPKYKVRREEAVALLMKAMR